MTKMKLLTICAALAGLTLAGCATPGFLSLNPGAAAEARGLSYAQVNCEGCHALGNRGPSPRATAPTFGQISTRYSSLSLERELIAINEVGHYEMRPIDIETSDIQDLVAYIMSLSS
jgi:cytochrome c